MQKSKNTIVSIVTAVPLDSKQRNILKSLIADKLGNEFEIKESVEPNHLGGIKLKIGSQDFDLTLSGKLKKIKTQTSMAEIVTAQKLTPAQKHKLQVGLAKKYGSGLLIKEIIDPKLIAGLRIRINDQEYDGSIATKLNKLQLQIKNNL